MNHHKIALTAVIAIIIVFIAAFAVGFYKTNRDNAMSNRTGNLMSNSMVPGDISLPATDDKQGTDAINPADGKAPDAETKAASNTEDSKTGDVSNAGGKTGATTPTADNEPPLTKADLKDIPEEFQPSESTALEAALVGAEDWVGKVTTHNNDWTTATVLIGPPQSEYVQELNLKWNREGGYYDVVRKKGVQ